MSINQLIEESLKTITENIWPLCCPDASPPDKYIVYNPELEKPGYYADDSDEEWIHYMQVHLYTKGNYLLDRNTIRKKLKAVGFTVTGIEVFYEKDSKYTHICFECYLEEEDA